jgi:RNA polymerase sigma-70 factor (ECF subfamily)
MDAMEIDEQVRALLARGDERGAATVALRHYGPRILRYLGALLRAESDAGEAFSVVAEQVWKGLPGFEWRSSLQTWMFRVAWFAALNLKREGWNRLGRPFATGEATALAEDIRTKSVVRVERQRQALDRLRESLTDEEQSLLSLRVDQGLAWEEIAGVLSAEGESIEPAALRKRFERLKDRLATLAREQGLVD